MGSIDIKFACYCFHVIPSPFLSLSSLCYLLTSIGPCDSVQCFALLSNLLFKHRFYISHFYWMVVLFSSSLVVVNKWSGLIWKLFEITAIKTYMESCWSRMEWFKLHCKIFKHTGKLKLVYKNRMGSFLQKQLLHFLLFLKCVFSIFFTPFPLINLFLNGKY